MYAFIVIIEMFQMFIERESETKNDKKYVFHFRGMLEEKASC